MTLADNIHVLTRPHLTNHDGTLRHAPALLAELRAAVTPGSTGSGSGSSGPPIPINPNALDLLVEIEGEARRDYHEITGIAWASTLETLLQQIAELNLEPEWDAYLTRVTLEWLDRIGSLLWPVKPRRKLVGKVCPSCGFAVYGEGKTCLSLGCWDDDGGMRKIGEWDIECGSCEAGWSGDQVTWLLAALDAKEDVDA